MSVRLRVATRRAAIAEVGLVSALAWDDDAVQVEVGTEPCVRIHP